MDALLYVEFIVPHGEKKTVKYSLSICELFTLSDCRLTYMLATADHNYFNTKVSELK